MIKVALLECKSGAIAGKNGSFASPISLRLVRKSHNPLYMNILSVNAQNSRISHQRFCCALNEEY